MLTILSLISGFFSPYIGDVIGLFKAKQENAHELSMLKESNKTKRDIANLDAQVGMAQAEVDDVQSARAAQPTYGARLLDAVINSDGWTERYIAKPFLLVMLTIVEVLNGLMRPYAIYLILSLWASTKVARFWLALSVNGGKISFDADGAVDIARAVMTIWDDHDWAALDYALGFLLGSRHKLKEQKTP